MKLIAYEQTYHGKGKPIKRILFVDNGNFTGFSGDELEGVDLDKLIVGREYTFIYSNFDKNKVISFKEVITKWQLHFT